MLKPKYKLALLFVAVIFSIWFLWWASAGYPLDGPICYPPDSADNCQRYNVIFYSAWRLALVANYWGVLIGALATIAIAVFTWTLWQEGRKQREVTGNAVAVAECANELNRQNAIGSRRAWLSLEDVKLLHPTKFTEDGFTFRVSATAKHHGETPATSVWIAFESYFREATEVNFSDAEENFREKLRGHWGAMGETLFKGDTFTTVELWADGFERIKNVIQTRPSGERKFGFTVFIGVSYRVVGDPTAHITQYSFAHLNVPVGFEIPEGGTIDLPRQPFLAGHIT